VTTYRLDSCLTWAYFLLYDKLLFTALQFSFFQKLKRQCLVRTLLCFDPVRPQLRIPPNCFRPRSALYTLLIISEMWRQLVKYKEAFCLILNRNKDQFTNWRHASGIISKVYNDVWTDTEWEDFVCESEFTKQA